MFRGRYQLGEEIPLSVLCQDSAATPGLPTAAPTARIYDASGNRLVTLSLPPLDPAAAPGLFGQRVFLGRLYATGLYRVVYQYTVAAQAAMDEDTFEVAAGGDVHGAAIAMYGFIRPQAVYLVNQRDAGTIARGQNPRV